MSLGQEKITRNPAEAHASLAFRPDPRVALGQQMGYGLFGIVLAAAAAYFKTEMGLLLTLTIGLGVGVLLFALLNFRARSKGYESLILGEQTLTIENEKSRTVLPWSEIEKATRYRHGEERWEFHLASLREPVRFPLYGFLPPELTKIQDALLERTSCFEERTPMEGSRPLVA